MQVQNSNIFAPALFFLPASPPQAGATRQRALGKPGPPFPALTKDGKPVYLDLGRHFSRHSRRQLRQNVFQFMDSFYWIGSPFTRPKTMTPTLP
jgi:hypothetical protein